MGLRFKPGSNESFYITALRRAAVLEYDKFNVYTHETMPSRYHFSNNSRIAPIYIVPKLGYALTKTRRTGLTFVKGVRPSCPKNSTLIILQNHGYDNELPEMQAIFVADGPFSVKVKALNKKMDAREPALIDNFPNVEIKSLVGKLFGLTVANESHNGTAGFWDKYFK